MNIENSLPERGEIWIVNLDPTIGSEIKKSRPCIIISSNSIGILPLRLIAPLTKWKESFEENFWHLKIAQTDFNGLSDLSSIDTLQIRSIDIQRLVKRIGFVTKKQLEDINISIAALIEFQI
ncbi:MAG: type II toxin-antitoxin system PemK/MazF family toxin [Ignavibacteria bacterium]|nr:type II toxin-antitoxin system PemK/MazF family toxin [Ignavibacteria bacterium]